MSYHNADDAGDCSSDECIPYVDTETVGCWAPDAYGGDDDLMGYKADELGSCSGYGSFAPEDTPGGES